MADSLRARIEEALGDVRLRLGPNAIALAQAGEPLRLSGGERDHAADAVMAVVQDELDRLRAENTALLDLVADFVDHDPCDLDHHGYCQAHMWIGSPLPCPHGRAKAMFNLDSEETGS